MWTAVYCPWSTCNYLCWWKDEVHKWSLQPQDWQHMEMDIFQACEQVEFWQVTTSLTVLFLIWHNLTNSICNIIWISIEHLVHIWYFQQLNEALGRGSRGLSTNSIWYSCDDLFTVWIWHFHRTLPVTKFSFKAPHFHLLFLYRPPSMLVYSYSLST